ncbi:MAG: RagB/SusD family nutrient uptake outer membrane protein [Paludibacter sp.]|nr:RagB/SusD family nutrient uptake outer membrane protein [Paludibacter sp.]
MKIKKYILLLIPIVIASCDYLDFDESIGKSKEFYYAYFNQTEMLVSNIYSYLPTEYDAVDGALRESATDNATYVWKNCNVHKYYNGSWSPITPVDDRWSAYYSGIRAACSFLDNFNLSNYDKFKFNTDYQTNIEKATYYPHEVRFLRAFFYFELIKRYGSVPLLTRTYGLDEINNTKPAVFDSIVKFIADECDSAALKLPVTYTTVAGKETGRITKGACYALKSRLLLYAASELHNPGNANPEKWEAAALAAKQVIDMNQYQFDAPSFDLWSNSNASLASKQLILEARDGANTNDFEARNFPIGVEGGNTGNCPSQNLVDAFEMTDGSKFDWNNPVHAANPYVGRDPRLAKTVLFNGATFSSSTKIETFYGGRNAQPINGATTTGYYLKKCVNTTITVTPTSPFKKTHNWVLFRYAEVLLNYAEALNEWKGPDYKDAIFTLSAKEAVNKVRTQASMPGFTETDPATFREHLRNERRVELAFEDHRFWDLRRWKIASDPTVIYGVNITKDPVTSVLTYQKIEIERRLWEDKMYLYPIGQSERFRNRNLLQNPGWSE